MTKENVNHVVIDNEVTNQFYSTYGQTTQGNLFVRCDKVNKVFKTKFIQPMKKGSKKIIDFTHCPYCGGKLWKEN